MPSATEAVTSNPNWQTYIGKAGDFTIKYPPGCKLTAVSEHSLQIICYGADGGYFTIYPESVNRDIQTPPGWFNLLILGGKNWERKMTENKATATYSQIENGRQYIIAVEYQQFSDKAQSLAETIIATFSLSPIKN